MAATRSSANGTGLRDLDDRSKFQVESQSRRDDWAAIFVVAGMIDILKSERGIKSAPDVQRIKCLDDIFTGVIEPPVAKEESQPAERQIFLVIARDSVGNIGEPH